ncbi:RagB/SusD family nutrient uptake outer membrane protein [Paraflavitalea speifideaquila]|uniref:RagB/SusD family nutrient uptake outer membrane protein n=1 Tax=Paraflavitalea speifideaquila TaxID=3076558 RepID=UPI0028E3B571|nr:RagB/SusD family nutrient uptake outer membrane protein [Paraflavitalea speifideiaquila]
MAISPSKYTVLSLLLAVLLCTEACRKYETEPLYTIQDELVWDELDSLGTLAGWFLADIYTYLPNGFNRVAGDFLDAATDDALPSLNNQPVQYFTNGRINVLNNPDPYWGSAYYGIRAANVFLKNIDKVPNNVLRTFGKAEARFLRAMSYFELVKRYGGVPLIGDTVFTLQDNLQVPRNNFEQCVNYIVNECDAIKDQLRKETIADGDWGKAQRGAALALKSRVLLYAASPLMNGGGVESNPALRSLTGYPSYDASRWQKALDAADSVIALKYYALQASFNNVFTVKRNTEVIFAKQRGNTFDIETNNAPVGYGDPAISYGLTSPTQNLVDAFPMTNGQAITSPTSGYNPQAPYTNRDPRLALTVFCNGATWLKRSVETFTGGKDKPGGTTVQTRTGYYLRKFMADMSNNTTYTNQSHNFIYFRYAEILLNKAEALNELGRTTEVYDQLVLLRKRAGITAGSNNLYGLTPGLDQTQMRSVIRNERRIELAFEEHRFWDIRRWKIAPDVLTGQVKGMRITKDAGTSALTFQVVDAAPVTFNAAKLYHLPIPYSEIVKNQALVQNEGW